MKHHQGNLRKMQNAAAPKKAHIITETPRVIVTAAEKPAPPEVPPRTDCKTDWEMRVVVWMTVVLAGLAILLAGRIGGVL